MGVYIPNIEKPKDCKECQWHLDFYIEDEQVGGLCTITEKDDKENTCPLIEIDLEQDIPTVWHNGQTGQYEPKGTKQEVYERLYKLKNGEERVMGAKEYKLPDGRKAVFEFDENGVGKITLEAMDLLMGMVNIDLVRCGECKHKPIKYDPEGDDFGFNLESPNGYDNLCPCLNTDDGFYSYMPDDNFFCAFGERRADK